MLPTQSTRSIIDSSKRKQKKEGKLKILFNCIDFYYTPRALFSNSLFPARVLSIFISFRK